MVFVEADLEQIIKIIVDSGNNAPDNVLSYFAEKYPNIVNEEFVTKLEKSLGYDVGTFSIECWEHD